MFLTKKFILEMKPCVLALVCFLDRCMSVERRA